MSNVNFLSKRVAAVNKKKCVACGTCIKECPKNAISIWRGCYAVIEAAACIGCGKCAKVCPTGCIEVNEREAE